MSRDEITKAEIVGLARANGCTCAIVEYEIVETTGEHVAFVGEVLPPGDVVASLTAIKFFHVRGCPLNPEHR